MSDTTVVLSKTEGGREYLTLDGWEAMKRTVRSSAGCDPLRDRADRLTHGKVLRFKWRDGEVVCGLGDNFVATELWAEVCADRDPHEVGVSAVRGLSARVISGGAPPGAMHWGKHVHWPSPSEAMELTAETMAEFMKYAVTQGDSHD